MAARPVSLASVLVFPVIMGGTVALAIALLPVLGTATTLSVATGVGLVAVALAERVWPHLDAWGRSHGDVGTDLLHAFVSGVSTTSSPVSTSRTALVQASRP